MYMYIQNIYLIFYLSIFLAKKIFLTKIEFFYIKNKIILLQKILHDIKR